MVFPQLKGQHEKKVWNIFSMNALKKLSQANLEKNQTKSTLFVQLSRTKKLPVVNICFIIKRQQLYVKNHMISWVSILLNSL